MALKRANKVGDIKEKEKDIEEEVIEEEYDTEYDDEEYDDEYDDEELDEDEEEDIEEESEDDEEEELDEDEDDEEEEAPKKTSKKVVKKKPAPAKKPNKKVVEEEDDLDEDDDEEEEAPKKTSKKAPAKKKAVVAKKTVKKPNKKVVEEEDDLDEDDDEEEEAPKKTSKKKDVKKSTSKKKVKDEENTPSDKLSFVARSEKEEIPEDSSVGIETMKNIMANNLADILNSSSIIKDEDGNIVITKIIGDKIIKSYEAMVKEILEKKSTFIFCGMKFKRAIVKGRIYANSAIKGDPTFIPPHVEMKLPPFFDSEYKDSKVVLKEKNGKFYYKKGSKMVALTDEDIEEMDDELISRYDVEEETKPKKTTSKKKSSKKK